MGVLTPNLDEAFYPALWTFANSVGVPAEWFLNFMFLESRFDPSAYNGKYAGLNQIDQNYLQNHFHVDVNDYRTWLASDQLTKVIGPFFKGQLAYLGHTPRSAGVLYALNVYPGSLKSRGDSPDSVVISKFADESTKAGRDEVRAYYANANGGKPNAQGHCGLDWDCSGDITVGDLDAILDSLASTSLYQTYLKKLHEYGNSNLPAPGSASTGHVVLAWILAATVGAGAFVAYRRFVRDPRQEPTTRRQQIRPVHTDQIRRKVRRRRANTARSQVS
jgi:hypothetical protein